MTEKQLKKFESELEKRGYKRYPPLNNCARAWYRGFHKGAYQDGRSAYQICFEIWDWTPYADRDPRCKTTPYSIGPQILISRTTDERMDMEITAIKDERFDTIKTIDKIEEMGESLYQWAVQNVECEEKRYDDL